MGRFQTFLYCFKSAVILGVTCGLFSLSPASFGQEVVGRLLMSVGQVEIQRADKTFSAPRNTEVLVGDTVLTGPTSNAQVRFTDGAIVALRSDSRFQVNEYRFSGKTDGTEKASYSLLKGGVRAVTGAIGRGNRDNLKVDAVVATVGIRGTGFNIKFCDAACQKVSPAAKEGLYAGVFEGKISVANRGGSAVELGVNRFVFIQNEFAAPQALIEPPPFLKDSLDAQGRVKTQGLAANQTTASSEGSDKTIAVAKTPSETSGGAASTSAEQVSNVNVSLVQPDAAAGRPRFFFDRASGSGSLPPQPSGGTLVLRAAEYTPGGGAATEKINLDGTINVGYRVESDGSITQFSNVVVGNVVRTYSINSSYRAESGSDGSIAWGRWSNGEVNTEGNLDLTANHGWHYIMGNPYAGNFSGLGSVRMNLIGATVPTETRSAAQLAWRVSGGSLDVNFASRTLSGLLNLYYSNADGFGNYNMTWSGSGFPDARGGLKTDYAASVIRTSGTSPICTSACTGAVAVGFYGSASYPGGATGPSHAGSTYKFGVKNAGTSYSVTGAAVFKR